VETSFWKAYSSRPCTKITEVRCACRPQWNSYRKGKKSLYVHSFRLWRFFCCFEKAERLICWHQQPQSQV